MLCFFVMLVFLMGAIVIFTQYGKHDGDEEPALEGSNGGSGNGGNRPGSDNRPPPPNVLPTDNSSTVVADSTSTPGATENPASDPKQTPSPTGSTGTTTTTTMRTKLTYTGATVKPRLFVCYVMIYRWNQVETTPDGICDLTIADEGCRAGARFDNFLGHHKSFFDRSKNDVKTKYGIVACSRDPEDFYDWEKNVDTLRAMYQNNMRHFGFNEMGRQRDTVLAAAFTIAKKVITEVFQGDGSIVFVPDKMGFEGYERLARFAKSKGILPDLFIIRGHLLEPPRNLTDRSLLPAINLYRPSTRYYRANYGRTLADAAEESLSLLSLGVAAEIVILLTFGATSERMLYPDNLNDNLGRYAIYQPAVFPQDVSMDPTRRYFIDPRTVCNASDPEYLRNMQYQGNAATWVTYNKGRRIERSYTLDTAETFRFKMCNFFLNYTNVKAKLNFGMSDLDYDAHDVDCRAFKLKAFDRMRMFRAVNDFVYKEYWDPSDLYFCLRVTP
ncbi:uncharacterized protein LOC144100032 [Amblyomma americanum]